VYEKKDNRRTANSAKKEKENWTNLSSKVRSKQQNKERRKKRKKKKEEMRGRKRKEQKAGKDLRIIKRERFPVLPARAARIRLLCCGGPRPHAFIAPFPGP